MILSQINTLIDSVEEAATSAEKDIEARKSSPEFRIPVENRIETIPFIDRYFHGTDETPEKPLQQVQAANDVPVFVPLRPFWAVVSYAGSLMGYIALQLALDFSPAVLGLLFALLAPFPDRGTRLGRAWEDFWARRFEKWTPPAERPVARPVRAAAPVAAANPVEPVQTAQKPVGAEDVAIAEPVRAVDDGPAEETENGGEEAEQQKAALRQEPRFEDEKPEEDDHIRDDKPGDVRPY